MDLRCRIIRHQPPTTGSSISTRGASLGPRVATRASRPVPATSNRFAHSEEPDDFRHRMVVNAVAFLFVVALVVAGAMARGHDR